MKHIDRPVTSTDLINLTKVGIIVYRRKDASTVNSLVSRVSNDTSMYLKWGYYPESPDEDAVGRKIIKCNDCNYCHQFINCRGSQPKIIGRWCSIMGMNVAKTGTCGRGADKWGPVMHIIGDNLDNVNSSDAQAVINNVINKDVNIGLEQMGGAKKGKTENVDNSTVKEKPQDVVVQEGSQDTMDSRNSKLQVIEG